MAEFVTATSLMFSLSREFGERRTCQEVLQNQQIDVSTVVVPIHQFQEPSCLGQLTLSSGNSRGWETETVDIYCHSSRGWTVEDEGAG